MTCREWLEVLANIASIVTAVLAAIFALWYWVGNYRVRTRLENHLKAEKEKDKNEGKGKKGQRSILHLIAKVGLTDAEILGASFRSRHIVRRLKTDAETNLATDILFEYSEAKNSN